MLHVHHILRAFHDPTSVMHQPRRFTLKRWVRSANSHGSRAHIIMSSRYFEEKMHMSHPLRTEGSSGRTASSSTHMSWTSYHTFTGDHYVDCCTRNETDDSPLPSQVSLRMTTHGWNTLHLRQSLRCITCSQWRESRHGDSAYFFRRITPQKNAKMSRPTRFTMQRKKPKNAPEPHRDYTTSPRGLLRTSGILGGRRKTMREMLGCLAEGGPAQGCPPGPGAQKTLLQLATNHLSRRRHGCCS